MRVGYIAAALAAVALAAACSSGGSKDSPPTSHASTPATTASSTPAEPTSSAPPAPVVWTQQEAGQQYLAHVKALNAGIAAWNAATTSAAKVRAAADISTAEKAFGRWLLTNKAHFPVETQQTVDDLSTALLAEAVEWWSASQCHDQDCVESSVPDGQQGSGLAQKLRVLLGLPDAQ